MDDSDSAAKSFSTERGTGVGVGAGPDVRVDWAGMNTKGGRGLVPGSSVIVAADADIQAVV